MSHVDDCQCSDCFERLKEIERVASLVAETVIPHKPEGDEALLRLSFAINDWPWPQ